MRASIGNDKCEIFFGRGIILEGLEADPVVYGGEFPGRSREGRPPEIRHIAAEGYILSRGCSVEKRRHEIGSRCRALAAVTSPQESFFLKIGDRYADCTDGELSFKRKAPFSGDEAEHFTLRAVIKGGFFHGSTITVPAERKASGFHFPISFTDDSFAFGSYENKSYIQVNNRGDTSVGFTAELCPQTAISSFRLENLKTGKYIACTYDFAAGDVIKISTLLDNLQFKAEAGGSEINLTGYADTGSEFFTLSLGESRLVLEDGAAYTGSLSFRESYISF